MNTAEADQVIIGSLAITTVFGVAHKIATTKTAPDVVRGLVGLFLAASMLTLAAEVQPELAASLAVLTLVAAIVNGGPDVWTAIGSRTRVQSTTPTGPSAAIATKPPVIVNA